MTPDENSGHSRRTALIDVLFAVGMMTLGLLLRLPGFRLGIWRDEASTYFDAAQGTIGQLIDSVIFCDLSPPGFYLIMHYWINWFGASEVSLKVPALLFGVLLIGATYVLGRVACSRGCGMLAATMAAFSPHAVYQSQEARPYTLTALLCCILAILFCQYLRSNPNVRNRYLVASVICASLLLYVQYTALLLLGSLGLIVFLLRWRKMPGFSLWPPVIAFVVVALIFAPWLRVFITHFRTGTPWTDTIPLLQRPVLLLHNLSECLPLPDAPILKPVKLAIVLVVVLIMLWEAKKLLARLDFSSAEALQRVLLVVVGTCYVLPALMETVISKGGRYVFPFTAMGWVVLSSILLSGARLYARYFKDRRGYRAFGIVFVLGCLGLLAINARTALITGSGLPKSGVPALSEQNPRLPEGTFFLLGPDFLGPTFGYYAARRKKPVVYHGVGRWERPEMFSPAGYADLWRSPALISDTLRRVESTARSGYQHLAFVKGISVDGGQMRFSRTESILSQLKQRYSLLRKTEYPAFREPVTLYLFKLTRPSSRIQEL